MIMGEKGDSTTTFLLRLQNWPLKLQQYEIKIWHNSIMISSEFETRGKIEGLHNQQCGEGCDNTQAVDSEKKCTGNILELIITKLR